MVSGTASQVVGTYVEFQAAVLRALPRDIAPEVALSWTKNGESLTRVLREALMPSSEGEEILSQLLGTVVVPATTEPFVARDKFVAATTPAKISWVGSRLQEWFFGKIEEPVAEMQLQYAELVKPSTDRSILDKLGDKAETTLTQAYALMKRQPNGEEGVLLTNGWTNIFYVKDVNGALRVVSVDRDGAGWSADADSVTNSSRWLDGDRVFSRNS